MRLLHICCVFDVDHGQRSPVSQGSRNGITTARLTSRVYFNTWHDSATARKQIHTFMCIFESNSKVGVSTKHMVLVESVFMDELCLIVD